MSDIDESKITFMALKFYPPTVRDDLLKSGLLGAHSDRLLQTWVHLGSDDLSFLRCHLYDAFRKVLQGVESCRVTDKSGREWTLSQSYMSGNYSIRFEYAETNFLVSDCYGLHSDSAVRTQALRSAAKTDGMSLSKYQGWLSIISLRPFDDDEMSRLHSELARSPGKVEREIVEHIASRGIDYPTLIPDFSDYYVDLIGDVGQCADISEFSATVARKKFREILDFEGSSGLKRILGLSSHATLVDQIDLKSFEVSEVEKAFDWIAKNADIVSKVGAVELAIAYGECSPKIVSAVITIIEEIRNADSSKYGFLTQFCDLVLLVGGEFARNRLFISAPPYWRRLAVFTHAAVLQRAVVATQANITGLSDSHCDNRAPLFLIQTAIDLRLEPRWQSGYLGPEQLKAEFLGRILMAGERHSETIDEQLKHYILDDPTLRDNVKFPLAYLPGPLEGGIEPAMILPQDLVSAIESALSSSPLELSSFVPLVNSALVFKLNPAQADWASKALRTANYQLRAENDAEDLEPVLAGLATVAAVTRSPSLGDEVIVLIRAMQHRSNNALDVNQVLTIGLIAAASRAGEQEWIDFVGKLFAEVCFRDITQFEARSVRFVLFQLCRLKPELWRSVGGAYAALESILPYGG